MTDSETEPGVNPAVKRRRLADTETEVPERHERDAQLNLSRRSDRRFCPHCREELSVRTFKFHKRLYYDKVRRLAMSVIGLHLSLIVTFRHWQSGSIRHKVMPALSRSHTFAHMQHTHAHVHTNTLVEHSTGEGPLACKYFD